MPNKPILERKRFDGFEMSIRAMKTVLKAIKPFSDEFRMAFNLEDHSITIKTVDPANVCMAAATIAVSEDETVKSRFPAKSVTLGIETEQWERAMKLAPDDGYMAIDLFEIPGATPENMAAEAHLTYFTKTIKTVSTIRLIDPAAIRKEPTIPRLDSLVTCPVRSSDFKRVVKTWGKDFEHVRLVLADNLLSFKFNDAPLDILSSIETNNNGNESTLYSMKYLRDFVKILDHGTIAVRFATDYPLSMVAPMSIDGYSMVIEYLLAPRIENC